MVTGLFECRKRDENKLIKNLITGEIDPCLTCSSSPAFVKIQKGQFNFQLLLLLNINTNAMRY